MKPFIKAILSITSILFLVCCHKTKDAGSSDNDIKQNENIKTEISTDIDKLKRMMNVTDYDYPLQKVKFKYTFFDNSQGRISSPSDLFLEVVLYFDDEAMTKIKEIDKNADFPKPEFQKKEFKFDWLDNETLSEFEKSDNQSAHPDFIFGKSTGKCWYLKNKILYIYHY